LRHAICAAVLGCLVGLAPPTFALAAGDATPMKEQVKKPADTQAVYIAMLYEKILHGGEAPDFEDWVRKSPDYENAQLYERPNIVEKNSKNLKDTFQLITYTEPIILSLKVHISGYSKTANGFFVQNFQNMSYFDYTYLGQRYAVIPNGLAQYQWLKAVPEEVPEIMRETDNGSATNLVISLVPMSADPKPMTLNGKTYNLMMTDISKIEIWSKDGSHVVWDDKMNAPSSVRSQLLDLFQH
jgi:hypothetical protein